VAQHPEDARRLLRTWLRVRLWTSAAALTAVAVGLLATGTNRSTTPAIFLLVLVYAVGGLIGFLHYFYRGLSRSDIESTLTLWQRFAVLAAAIAVLQWRPNVTALALAMLMPALATLAYSLRRAWRTAGEQEKLARQAPRAIADPTGLQDVVPIGIGLVLSALYFRIDVFLIEMWQGTEDVALYNAVFRLVEALRLFPAAVLAVALPTLFRATSTRPLLSVSAVVTAFSVVVTLGLWAIAGWLVPVLYGDRYAEAVHAFRLLLLALPLMSLNYALTHQLIGWNGHRAYAAISAAALVFNVALNARLIPALSIEGAAWSTLATEALLSVGCVTALWMRSSRPRPDALATVSP
jgi:O-antigen/teichoic acid export membrane protein